MKCEQTQYLRYLTPNQQWRRRRHCDVLSHVINRRSAMPERSWLVVSDWCNQRVKSALIHWFFFLCFFFQLLCRPVFHSMACWWPACTPLHQFSRLPSRLQLPLASVSLLQLYSICFFYPDWKAIVLIQHTVSPSFLFNTIWKQRKTCWNVAAWSWPRPPLGAFMLVPTKAVRLASPLQLWQAVDEWGTTVPARGAFHWCFKKRKTEKRIRYEDRK